MKRQKKITKLPLKPFDRQRMERESEIMKKYGLRRKKEVWRAEYILSNIRRSAIELIGSKNAEKEKILIDKLKKLGILTEGSTLDDVLALQLENILDRRLQTLVYKRNLANTLKQARQFIVHGHIAVNERKINWPSALISVQDENKIAYHPRSKLNSSFVRKKVEEAKKETEILKKPEASGDVIG